MSFDDDNTELPTRPSPSSGCESVEVTGIHAITTFSTTIEFDPDWTVSQVASYLHSHLSYSAERLFELDSPVDMLGLSIFNCRFYTIRIVLLMTHHIYTAATIEQPGGLQRPITEVKAKEKEKYLIMFDLPSDHANIVETYIKDNKENLAIARGDRLVREEDELKAKKVKGKNKDEAGNCHCVSTDNLRIEYDFFHSKIGYIVTDVESTPEA
jgi:hypothetical protein